ncbi:homoserine kinase [Pueribacillus sp. YX66]|uniref:homoserine kinase n=1 Tax=Pueribacillus sp. YX66 TaxID=3229242 RepID=UPI00358D384C
MNKLTIKVPGSTANLGPGFDSIGLAVNLYLRVEAVRSERWEFSYETPGFESIPTNEDNLIYKAAQFTAKQKGMTDELPAHHVTVTCELPLASGLGSSAAAIVAGIELADQLLALSLSKQEKARIASLYEGHPDNVAASVYGGLVIATHHEDETFVVESGTPELDMVIMIPNQELLTSESRDVLPTTLTFQASTRASSVANVLVASLLKGDVRTAGKMMRKDLFHQPYREKIVPDLPVISAFGEEKGIEGVALSGAGPSIMCYTNVGKGAEALQTLQAAFPVYQCRLLQPAKEGSTVTVVNETFSKK